MKKKFLLITLMMCILGGINLKTLNAQNVVTIDGTVGGFAKYEYQNNDTPKLPIYNNEDNAITQIYYTADELHECSNGGTINSISFKLSENATQDSRKIDIYMKNSTSSVFATGAMIQLTSDDCVFSSGENEFEFKYNEANEGWIEIKLNNPFEYESGKNILICVNDKTGRYQSSSKGLLYFETFKTTDIRRSLYKYNRDGSLDPSSTLSGSCNFLVPYIQFTFSSSSAPTAPTLKSPADNATDQFNPTLSWIFGENTEEYQVLLAKASDDFPEVDAEKWIKTQNATEGSYTTSGLGLERGTKYKWQVVTRNLKGETSSDIYYFTTLDIPTAPELTSPGDKTTVDINKPTLEFTLSNNTTQYQILLDKNGTPTTVEKDWTYGKGDVSYQTSKLDADATYYWKVIAKNDAGEVESGIYQFTTAKILRVIDYEIKLDENNITLKWQYADQNANKYQVYFGKPEEDIVIWNNPEWVPRETVEGKLVDDGSFTITKDADFGDKVYFRVDVSDGEETVEGATVFCVILDKNTDWGDSYNNADYVFVRANVRVVDNITAKNITIENGGILRTVMDNVDVVVSANTLVVNEGGQFFAANKLTYFPINTVKFNKKIVNPEGEWKGANNKTGWQFISSPFKDAPISSFIPGQEEGDYDLYKYDGSAEKPWVNHKDSELAEPFAEGEKFAPGIGYLASYETKDNLTFTRSNGSINRTNTFNIGSDGMMETPGIYLLGNPFLFNMDWEKISANAYGINATSFVVVKADGAYEYKTSGEIKVGEGFFVLTTGNAAFNCTFVANDIVAASSSKSRNAEQSKSLNIIATGNAGNDNVVVNFNGEGEGFPKLQNFNDDIATVYVQNNDANYGVYNCDENTTEVELCFNANQMGNYTISVEPTGEFSNIVLVDRFTGIETNLLVDDYHFTAMSEENNNRFFIRLGNGQQTTDNSHFVFQSGEELIIEAEGTVQIIDMMGRVVYTSNVENNNRINVSDFNNGAYVVRVINESEIKVEKVVIY